MTNKQNELLTELKRLLPGKQLNTRQIRIALGHKQAYETSLKNRLMRLEAQGHIKHTIGQRNSRNWELI